MKKASRSSLNNSNFVTLFLCGDVMTGRGIDQILPHPSAPRIYESYVKNASEYVHIAERVNGPIPNPVGYDYIWGDALVELEYIAPDFRIINLETSVTTSDDFWRGKGINYRMHPQNIPSLTAAGIDCCVLANNHIMDWGYGGMQETLSVLSEANILSAGAGQNLEQAQAPALLQRNDSGRVLVFSFGSRSSGIPHDWAALQDRPGVNLIPDYTDKTTQQIADQVTQVKQGNDIVIASIHWGGNWGYDISRHQKNFARQLIDSAGVDMVHGHSSHHIKGIEIYKDKPIIYGCGDFLNDYEGIGGYAAFRSDLALMYFPTFDRLQGKLVNFVITPMQIKRFCLNRVSDKDVKWLKAMLAREAGPLGTRVARDDEDRFILEWT